MSEDMSLSLKALARRSVLDGAELIAASLDQAPDAVDGVVQLRTGLAALVSQVSAGGSAHEEEFLLSHLADDRVAIKEFRRLANRPHSPLNLGALVDLG
jgi:hypothetical protein